MDTADNIFGFERFEIYQEKIVYKIFNTKLEKISEQLDSVSSISAGYFSENEFIIIPQKIAYLLKRKLVLNCIIRGF